MTGRWVRTLGLVAGALEITAGLGVIVFERNPNLVCH